MIKEEIYVVIDSEKKRLRAIEILRNSGEVIEKDSAILKPYEWNYSIGFCDKEINWGHHGVLLKTQITLEELEAILSPNYAVKDVHLTIDELKAQAEMLGFELVKKERKPKVGDFGVFWDDSLYKIHVYDFIHNTENNVFTGKHCAVWKNFRHLTEEEKAEIQNNW
jgi:hypothetical protein